MINLRARPLITAGLLVLSDLTLPPTQGQVPPPTDKSASLPSQSARVADLIRTIDVQIERRSPMGFSYPEYPNVNALVEIGELAGPALREVLKENSPQRKACAIMALQRLGLKDPLTIRALISALNDTQATVLVELLPAIRDLGPLAKDGIPMLRRALTHENVGVRKEAVSAIGKVSDFKSSSGQLDIQALTKVLKDREPELVLAAAEVLAVAAHSFDESLPIMLRAFEHGDVFVASKVLISFGQIANLRSEATAVILKGLHTEDRRIKISALIAFRQIETISDQLADGFRACLSNKIDMVRFNAVTSARELGSKASIFLPDLIHSLHDSYRPTREVAVLTIAAHPPQGQQVEFPVIERTPELTKRLQELSPELQSTNRATYEAAIKFLVTKARPAAHYNELRKEFNPGALYMFTEYLDELSKQTDAAITLLLKDLNDPAVERQNFALENLQGIGVAAQRALPALSKMGSAGLPTAAAAQQAMQKIAVTGYQTRCIELAKVILNKEQKIAETIVKIPSSTVEQLQKIAHEKKEATPEDILNDLLYYLMSNDVSQKSKAAEALGIIGPRAAAATPKLLAELQTSTDFWARYYINALVAIEKEGAVGPLCEILKSARSSLLLGSVAQALGTLGEKAKAAIPILMKNIPNADTSILSPLGNYIATLGAIGPAAKEATPLLLSLLDNKAVTVEVITAIGSIEKGSGKADPKLIEILLSESSDSYWASHSLGQIGDTSPAVISALIKAMQGGREATGPIIAVGELGPRARAAIPVILNLLQNPNSNLGPFGQGKIQGLLALGKLGPDSRSEQFLRAVSLSSTVQEFREAAEKSLRQINENR